MTRIQSFVLFLFLISGMLLIQDCSSNKDVLELNPTELQIRVLDLNGNTVSGARVRLFRNLRNFESLTAEVNSGFTGSDGQVKFSGLQPVNYYFYVDYTSEGVYHSNYGSYNTEIGDYGSNYELADYLTENGLTSITISTMFSRPAVPTKVGINYIQVFYTGENESEDLKISDTSYLFLMLFKDYDFLDLVDNQLDKILTGYGLDISDHNSNQVGESYAFYMDDHIFDIAELKASEIDENSYSPVYSIIPCVYNENQDIYKYADDYISFESLLNDVLIDLSAGPEYPFRYKWTFASAGNDDFEIDIVLNWQ